MDSYVGQIVLFAFPRVPTNFMPCQGQSLQASQFPALAAVIGTRYGGSGQSFNLPDTSRVNPVPGFQYAICFNGLFPGGAEASEEQS